MKSENLKEIESPCVQRCSLDPKLQQCIACGRTLWQVVNWSKFTIERRREIMEDLSFNIYAMTKPETPEDYLALVDELLSELQNINSILKTACK